MNFKINLKKYLVLGFIGLGLVAENGNASENSDDYQLLVENANIKSVIDISKLSSEVDKSIVSSLGNVLTSNFNGFRAALGNLLPSTNPDNIDSVLNGVKNAVFGDFGALKQIERNYYCIEICKKLISAAVIVEKISGFNKNNPGNAINIQIGSNSVLGNILMNLQIDKLDLDNIIKTYKSQYKNFSDCGVLGIIETLFNHSSNQKADQFAKFMNSFIKDNRANVRSTINNKLDVGSFSMFEPFSDNVSQELRNAIDDNKTNIDKFLEFANKIGYCYKMTSDEAYLASQNPKLDGVDNLTEDQLAEASRCQSVTEMHNFISGLKVENDPNKGGNNKPDGNKDGQNIPGGGNQGGNGDEQGGQGSQDPDKAQHKKGFVEVKGLSERLGGKWIKAVSYKSNPMISGVNVIKLNRIPKGAKSDGDLDLVIPELVNNAGVVLDMSNLGNSNRSRNSVLSKLKAFYKFKDNTTGWANSQGNVFCHVFVEQ